MVTQRAMFLSTGRNRLKAAILRHTEGSVQSNDGWYDQFGPLRRIVVCHAAWRAAEAVLASTVAATPISVHPPVTRARREAASQFAEPGLLWCDRLIERDFAELNRVERCLGEADGCIRIIDELMAEVLLRVLDAEHAGLVEIGEGDIEHQFFSGRFFAVPAQPKEQNTSDGRQH